MAYIRGHSQAAAMPVIAVERMRQHNAQLRAELQVLQTEKDRLEASINIMRNAITEAHGHLTKQAIRLDTVRAQERLLAKAREHVSTLPEPLYGGREGLLAATAELLGRDQKQATEQTGPRHGTGRRYDLGCRCGACRAWKSQKDARRKISRAQKSQLINQGGG